MARRTGISGPPASFVVEGEWPRGRVEGPYAAQVVQRIVLAVEAAATGRSARWLAAEAGLEHTTVSSLLAGRVWPDVVTVAKLEEVLGVDVWAGPAG